MKNQTPPHSTYQLPDSNTLGAAVKEALDGATAARERLGRVMAVATAAAVRDILTSHRPGAPFDASAVELVEGDDGSLFPTGQYWTTAGSLRTFADMVGWVEAVSALHGMSEWTMHLDGGTRDVWHPLCTELPDRGRRPAYALDLVRAASLTLGPPPLAHQARAGSAMVEVLVCANNRDRYPAMVDPADQRDGYVRPWFDLDTVRRIAENTQEESDCYGHGSVDTVHVLDGTVDGRAHAVVLVVCWMWLDGERREEAVEVLQPNEDGRYAVGGHDWCWYVLSDDLTPLIPFTPDGA
ncbi:hypothetical protein [Streptomyces sp. DH12]|uniref:hypothetical protein n=1 Tax=Streptomyces sp. DH12 TaxID=2857010 RepID=UPI001E483D01|nr:hypothetical protein [Streptomyces sp. DH12]